MKTEEVLYHLFQTLPSIFFELIGQPETEASSYEFQSVEAKETGKRFDGLFVPAKRSRQPIYFVEVQLHFDEDLYYRLFTEIFLYLSQNKPNRDWYAIAIFSRRTIEPAIPRPYQWLIDSPHFKRVYLDELGEAAERSLGLGIIKLIVENESTAESQAKLLIQKVKLLDDEAVKQLVLESIEKVLLYKFPNRSFTEFQ